MSWKQDRGKKAKSKTERELREWQLDGGKQNLPHYSKHQWQNKLQFGSLHVIMASVLPVPLSVWAVWRPVWSPLWAVNTHHIWRLWGHLRSLKALCGKYATCVTCGINMCPRSAPWTLTVSMCPSWFGSSAHFSLFIYFFFSHAFLIITFVDNSCLFVPPLWSFNVSFCSLKIKDGRLTNGKILVNQTYFIEEDVIFCPEASCQDVPFCRQSTECTEGK